MSLFYLHLYSLFRPWCIHSNYIVINHVVTFIAYFRRPVSIPEILIYLKFIDINWSWRLLFYLFIIFRYLVRVSFYISFKYLLIFYMYFCSSWSRIIQTYLINFFIFLICILCTLSITIKFAIMVLCVSLLKDFCKQRFRINMIFLLDFCSTTNICNFSCVFKNCI